MIQKTLVLIKPDAVQQNHIGDILCRYEHEGLRIEAMEMRTIDPDFADCHYAEHVGREYYPGLRDFMIEGPLVALVVSGERAIERVRKLHGATDPGEAEPGTVRADFAQSTRRNAVHSSSDVQSARREIELWFEALA